MNIYHVTYCDVQCNLLALFIRLYCSNWGIFCVSTFVIEYLNRLFYFYTRSFHSLNLVKMWTQQNVAQM